MIDETKERNNFEQWRFEEVPEPIDMTEAVTYAILYQARVKGDDCPVDYGDAEALAKVAIRAVEEWQRTQPPVADKPKLEGGRIENVAEAIWHSTPTHCEVTWKEEVKLFSDKPWHAECIAEHRRMARAAIAADDRWRDAHQPATAERQLPAWLMGSARALLELDERGSLAPHGIGKHARDIISKFIARHEAKAALGE